MFTVFVIFLCCWSVLLGINMASARSEHWSRRSIVIIVGDAVVVVLMLLNIHFYR